jgi:hypothetical protein
MKKNIMMIMMIVRDQAEARGEEQHEASLVVTLRMMMNGNSDSYDDER